MKYALVLVTLSLLGTHIYNTKSYPNTVPP
jgi:hypothetical protein